MHEQPQANRPGDARLPRPSGNASSRRERLLLGNLAALRASLYRARESVQLVELRRQQPRSTVEPNGNSGLLGRGQRDRDADTRQCVLLPVRFDQRQPGGRGERDVSKLRRQFRQHDQHAGAVLPILRTAAAVPGLRRSPTRVHPEPKSPRRSPRAFVPARSTSPESPMD